MEESLLHFQIKIGVVVCFSLLLSAYSCIQSLVPLFTLCTCIYNFNTVSRLVKHHSLSVHVSTILESRFMYVS